MVIYTVVNRKLTVPGEAYPMMYTFSSAATSNEAWVPLATRQYLSISGSSETLKVVLGVIISCTALAGTTNVMMVSDRAAAS